jgi:hypothetical protein
VEDWWWRLPKASWIRVVLRIDAHLLVPPADPFQRWGFCFVWCVRMPNLFSVCTGRNYLKRRRRWRVVQPHSTGGLCPYQWSWNYLKRRRRWWVVRPHCAGSARTNGHETLWLLRFNYFLSKVLPRAKKNIFIALNDLQSGYLYQKMIAPLLCPLSFHSGIMLKLT